MFLSIKEFSERAGVSKQYLYKELKKPSSKFTPYKKKIKGKFMLNEEALNELFSENFINQNSTSSSKVDSTEVENVGKYVESTNENNVELLLNLIEDLRQETKDKDNQIQQLNSKVVELTERILEINNQLIEITQNQQKLTLAQNLLDAPKETKRKWFWQR